MNLPENLRRHPWKFAIALSLLVAATWFAYAHRGELTREAIMAHGKALPAGGFIAAFLVLPLLGFPVSILLVLAGIRFGLGGGMAMAAGGMLFHHFAAFRLAHGAFRQRVSDRLQRSGYSIPAIKAEHRVWFTALFAAIHGPPYAAKLYLLALTDIPFRIYLWAGAPVYILFCLIPVGAGSTVMRFDATWIYIILAVSSMFLLAGYRLKRRFGKSPDALDLP
jgi:uncharacterized membrane protein YdjX (TVP38/TMEM64 family)